MARRYVDISVALQAGIKSDPAGGEPKIHYEGHQESIPRMLKHFPGMTKEQLPGQEGWATEQCQISTHNGTHVDAPWHYATTMDGGKKAATIDEMPLEWFHQPGVKLDFRHFGNGYVVSAADIEAELRRIGHTLRPLEIVVVNTAAGARYGCGDVGRQFHRQVGTVELSQVDIEHASDVLDRRDHLAEVNRLPKFARGK